MTRPCFGAEAWKLAMNWLLFQGYAFCSFCQNPPKFGKAVRLLRNSVHAYSAARSWILAAPKTLCPKNLRASLNLPWPQGRSIAGWRMKMCFPCSAHFFRAFRGWQTLVLGSLHLRVSLFFPKQSWGLSNLDVNEKNGKAGNVRPEGWGLLGKAKDQEGGRGAERWWALGRSIQGTRALDSGQKGGE